MARRCVLCGFSHLLDQTCGRDTSEGLGARGYVARGGTAQEAFINDGLAPQVDRPAGEVAGALRERHPAGRGPEPVAGGFDRKAYQKAYMRAYMRAWRAARKQG